MRRRPPAWLAIGFAFSCSFMQSAIANAADAAADQDAVVRLTLESSETFYTGGLVRAYIEVLSAEPMYRAPRFPTFDIPGAIALQPERSGGSFSERRQGATWYGVRRGYAIFPQRPGRFEIPSVAVVLPAAETGAERLLHTTVTGFEVVAPATDIPAERLITSPRVTVRQAFQPTGADTREATVGGALERRIEIRAEDTLGMLIPPLEIGSAADAPDGLIAYPDPPEITDTGNRGRFTGGRTESATYLFSRPGTVSLPEITVAWWNPDRGSVNVETLPGIHVTVTAGAIAPAGDPRTWQERLGRFLRWLNQHLAQVAVTLIVGYAAYRAGVRLWQPAHDRYARWRHARMYSQARRWRDLRRASRNGVAGPAVAAFWRWIDGQRPGAAWSDVVNDPDLRTLWGAFERERYRAETPPEQRAPVMPSRPPGRRTTVRPDHTTLAPLNPTEAQSTTDPRRTPASA